MNPARYNITIWRGAIKPLIFRLPIDLTGCTAAIYYKNSSNVIQTIPLTVSEHSSSPVKWELSNNLTQEQTMAFPLGKNIPYELQVRTVDNKDYIYLYGDLKIVGGTNVN